MKQVYRLLLLFILMIVLCTFSACQLVYGKLFVDTKDLNGPDDTSLAVFDDEFIRSPIMKNYAFHYVLTGKGERSYAEDEYYHDYDKIHSGAVTAASGVLLQQVTYGKTDTIRFTIVPQLNQGNLRIVLLDITDNYKIIYDFSTNQRSEVEITGAKGKEYQIRAIAEDAKFDLEISREFS